MSDVGAGVLVVVLIAYFIPSLIANSRGHPKTNLITLANTFLGWTLIGWLVILVWALAPLPPKDLQGPTPETHVKCPDCAELVKKEARVCKHCGCKLIPQP